MLALPVSLQGPRASAYCCLSAQKLEDLPPQNQAEALIQTSTMLAAVPDWLAVQHNALSAACWPGFPWSFSPTAQHSTAQTEDEKEPWECLSRDLSWRCHHSHVPPGSLYLDSLLGLRPPAPVCIIPQGCWQRHRWGAAQYPAWLACGKSAEAKGEHWNKRPPTCPTEYPAPFLLHDCTHVPLHSPSPLDSCPSWI